MSVADFVRAKNFLITYPHCDVNNEAILNGLMAKDILVKHGIKYMICSKEFHQDGEEHHHVFVSLQAPLRLKRDDMTKLDLVEGERTFHPNIKSCKSPKDAINYVKKDGEYITYGQCPYNIPLSTKEKNELLLSAPLHQLVESGVLSIFKVPQLQKAISILQNELGDVEREKPKVSWYYGSTGTGKTRTAIQEAKEKYGEDYWISHQDANWFDGYHGQKGAILDDVRAASWPMVTMLRLLDRYKIQVAIKGGFQWWRPERIWITAPGRPEDIYKNYTTGQPYDCIEQLNRRIDEMIDFDAETEPIDQVLYWKD